MVFAFNGLGSDISVMRTLWHLLVGLSTCLTAYSQPEKPQQSLNHGVAFLNQSVDELNRRFQMLQVYQADAKRYRQKSDFALRLPSSGPLEPYYYQKSLASSGLTAPEKQRVVTSVNRLWQVLNKIDQTSKELETYIRLADYQRDNLARSDTLVRTIQVLFGQFSRDKDACYQEIYRLYRHYQPYQPTDPYLSTEQEMEQVLLSQQQLLKALPHQLDEERPSDWPVDRVLQSMLADGKFLAGFRKWQSKLAYPASDVVGTFKTAIQSFQASKRRAINAYTYAARQSARYGNEVYVSLVNQYNQELLASFQSFVQYSQPNRYLLNGPKFSPVLASEPPAPTASTTTRTVPFQDTPRTTFSVKPAASPASPATFRALNAYVDWINESLRQMYQLQVLVRNYASSADYYRDPVRGSQRANLTYSHESYKIPLADYQLLLTNSQHIPEPYRTAVTKQAAVLLSILTEMDGLSIELIAYTTQKQYLQDGLQRSDAILDRYAYLFDAVDEKKEQLYLDVRRIHESYPVVNPASAWNIAGKALLKTLDDDKEILFGVKAYLSLKTAWLPPASRAEADARLLIADEYKNLKGLQRYGRSNGLCPYSPYEDIAENSLRLAGMAQQVKSTYATSTTHPYQSFYFFYNNQLVYQYNKFSELAKANLLKAVTQPDIFIFRRASPSSSPVPSPGKNEPPATEQPVNPKPAAVATPKPAGPVTNPLVTTTDRKTAQHEPFT